MMQEKKQTGVEAEMDSIMRFDTGDTLMTSTGL